MQVVTYFNLTHVLLLHPLNTIVLNMFGIVDSVEFILSEFIMS